MKTLKQLFQENAECGPENDLLSAWSAEEAVKAWLTQTLPLLLALRPNEVDCDYHAASMNFCLTWKSEYKPQFKKCENCKIRLDLKEILEELKANEEQNVRRT